MEAECIREEHRKELAAHADTEQKLREEVRQLDAELTQSVQAAEEASEAATSARKCEQELEKRAARAEVSDDALGYI